MIHLTVNGHTHALDVPADAPLLNVLRNDLALNGPKFGCGLGECGACSVLIDGKLLRSCVMPVAAVGARRITTLEGLGGLSDPPNSLHAVQRAFITEQAAQCGYCLNGMILATVDLLSRIANPSEQQVRDALSHHLCRCGTHVEILKAVRRAAAELAQ